MAGYYNISFPSANFAAIYCVERSLSDSPLRYILSVIAFCYREVLYGIQILSCARYRA